MYVRKKIKNTEIPSLNSQREMYLNKSTHGGGIKYQMLCNRCFFLLQYHNKRKKECLEYCQVTFFLVGYKYFLP